ncbi:MAG: heme-binding protein, partial [Gemmatimonadetes bacterium]|nr:heme-binding protein [Gemmatimonadota bacterium]
MSHHRTIRLGCLLALIACQPAPVSSPTPVGTAATPANIPPLVVENAAPFTAKDVRLSPDSAARLSKMGRDSVVVQVAPGLQISLWAPVPLVADIIGIGFDDQGRLYATSTGRSSRDEIDIRGHPDWMVSSILFKDVEDKRAFYKRVLAPENSAKNQWLDDWNGDGSKDWRDLTFHKEGIYRLEDTNGDGVADYSKHIFQDLNDLVTDVAHGILSYGKDLYLTASPDIWRLRDTNGDGVIDTKESIAHGSGVHIGFGGHGLSGPLIGPDGRLYWKQGDLGVNITTRDGRKLYNPMSGVIMRANPDGTEAEIFASGLRNPQEYAFDEYGNLISPDNDGDHPGELERLVYVVDGMESGWRINWQFGKYVDPDNNTYKVWMDESLFKPRFAGQAAYITPPLASWHAGPAGFDYNPGTALDDAWRGYFFGSVFTGTPSGSSIQGFTLAPQGAGFRLVEDKIVMKGLQITGLKFGPDGALYAADWIEGWDPKEKGKIWKIDAIGGGNSAARAETKALIAASFGGKSVADLVELLHHADMRVRIKAQFELVARNASADLLASARQTHWQMARIHGIWGIGQLARKDMALAVPLVDMLKDGDPEIRAQAAKLIGDLRYAPAATALVPQLLDPVPRARFFAAEALGRIKYQPAVAPLVDMLAANNDEDVYLRHAGATALSRIGMSEPLVALTSHPSRGVRLAAVVALRRMRDPGVARFLHDRDELVVTEAARAINDDGGIEGALPALAALLDSAHGNEALMRRVISANSRLGTPDAARRVALFAARASADEEMRAEAISVLGVWPKPSVLDRVDGSNLGPVQRDTAVARAAIASLVEPLFANGTPVLQVALADAIGRLRLTSASTILFDKVRSSQAPSVRVASLRALATLHDERTEQALRAALTDQDVTVRMAALSAIPPLNLPEATTADLLASVVGKGSVAEQQAALTSLGQIKGITGREALTRLVDQLAAGKVAPDIQLDVAEAARATKHAPLIARLDEMEKSRAGAAPLVAYADALRGGDARRGGRVIFQGPAAQCTRCHNFGNGPGASVGPALQGVASRLTREQLLEALVDPSARIAPGFGPVQVTLKNNQKLFGTLKEETDSYITVDVGAPEPRKIMKTEI